MLLLLLLLLLLHVTHSCCCCCMSPIAAAGSWMEADADADADADAGPELHHPRACHSVARHVVCKCAWPCSCSADDHPLLPWHVALAAAPLPCCITSHPLPPAPARYAIAMAFRDNQRVIYTSPIKALSNQKFRELQVRGGGGGRCAAVRGGRCAAQGCGGVVRVVARQVGHCLCTKCDNSYCDNRY